MSGCNSANLCRDWFSTASIRAAIHSWQLRRHIAVVLLVSVAMVVGGWLSAGAALAANAARAGHPKYIDIQIDSTRPRLTAGAGLGVTALVTNVSDSVIHLHERHITMAPPPELVGERFPSGWWAHFPTELHSGKGDAFYDVAISIAPGESYKVFWYANPLGQPDQEETSPLLRIYRTVSTELSFLFFAPGEYNLTVAAKYWVDPQKPTGGKYHTQIASKTVVVESPQSVILVGAGVGGLIAYFILPKARRRLIESVAKDGRRGPLDAKIASIDLVAIVGAVLLSAIVTILLARISETQFLIRVTVADFWGAVAIGFIANAIGVELIDKLIKSQSRARDGGETAPATEGVAPKTAGRKRAEKGKPASQKRTS